MPDDGILLFLDRGSYGAHSVGSTFGKRGEQERVLDCNSGIEARKKSIFADIELAAQEQICLNSASVRFIGSRACTLVVVDLGYWRAPIDH